MPDLPRSTRHLAAAACWLPFAVLGVALAAVPLVPSQLRWLHYAAVPPAPVLALLAAYFAVAFATRRRPDRRAVHAALVGLLLLAHLAGRAQPLGDANTWRDWAHSHRAGASELLANALYRLVYCAGGDAALDHVAPVVGAVFGWVFLAFVERALVAAAPRRAAVVRLLGAGVLALSGWQLVCCRGYVENTLLSLPFLVLGVGALMRSTDAHGTRELAIGAAWLTVAALCHGVQTAMWPLLLVPVLWRRWRDGPAAGIARPLLVVAAVVVAVVAATVGALLAAGFTLHAGHVAGGGDGRHFVPLQIVGSAYHYDFAMFDVAHVADVGNILLFTSPLALAALLLVASRRWRRAAVTAVVRQPVLAVAGAGAAALTAVYYFDLRFPQDVDLMVAMSAPLGLCLLQLAARAPRRLLPWLGVAIAANGALVWVLAASLLATPAAVGTDAASLQLNGRTGDVALRPGEPAFLTVVPPPDGAPPFTFTVFACRGTPAPPDAAARARFGGFDFAPPGSAEDREHAAFLVLDAAVIGVAGYVAPPITGPWLSAPLGGARDLGPLTVQAQLRDARGTVTIAPAIRVLPR